MVQNADVVIIGGGIAGVSAAAMLAGDAKVIVLEAEDQLGYHSTGRSAAIYFRNYGNETVRALNDASAATFENPENICDGPLLSERGLLFIANENEIAAMGEFVKGAIGLEELSADDACKIVPILKKDQIKCAVYEAGVRDIDVDLLLHGYARKVRINGGQVINRAKVVALAREQGKWHIETEKPGSFAAPVIVNAAGAWADKIAVMAGIAPVGLMPLRRSMVVVPPPAGHDISKWPLFASAAHKWYAKPGSGKLMISPADEDLVEPHDAWADDMVIAEGIARFEKAVDMTITHIEHSWAGLRSFAPDQTPVVGFANEDNGFFWLAGQGGYGVQTSPGLSELCAQLILGRQVLLDRSIVAALSPLRFATAIK